MPFLKAMPLNVMSLKPSSFTPVSSQGCCLLQFFSLLLGGIYSSNSASAPLTVVELLTSQDCYSYPPLPMTQVIDLDKWKGEKYTHAHSSKQDESIEEWVVMSQQGPLGAINAAGKLSL